MKTTSSISNENQVGRVGFGIILGACLLGATANAQSIQLANWNFGAWVADSNYASVLGVYNTDYFEATPLLTTASAAVSPTGFATPSMSVSITNNKLQYTYPASSTFSADNTLITLTLVAKSSIILSDLSVSFDYAHAPSFNQLYANWTDSSNSTVFRQLINYNGNTPVTLTQALNSSITLAAGQTLTLKLALDGLNKANTYIYFDNFSVNSSVTANNSQQAPVPEPSTYGLALGGLALAVVAARRRSKK